VTSRLFLKLSLAFLSVIGVATLTLDLVVRTAWEGSLYRNLETGLEEKARLYAQRVEADAQPAETIARDVGSAVRARATQIAADGRVVADTEADPRRMENHAGRPEFAAALRGQVGKDVRHSHTVGTEFLYLAVPIRGGAVRLAYPTTAIQQEVRAIRQRLFLASAVAVLAAMLLAAFLARSGTRRMQRIAAVGQRIADGDLAARVEERSFDEIGQLAAALDTTARRLEHSFKEVERVEKTRRDFIANVSHELRTPLTSIQGYAEALAAGNLPREQQAEFLQVILKNTARMARLTEDLLALARVESGEETFERAPVAAADILREVESSFAPTARAQGIELAVVESPPATVLADRHALHEVLANLVDNAFKYAAGGKRVEVGARAAAGKVEFYVRDHGPGIAAEHLPRLFERFYRVDKARSRESGGTGLGLAIAKHIVLAHGGSIHARSEPRKGAEFYFTLPLAG